MLRLLVFFASAVLTPCFLFAQGGSGTPLTFNDIAPIIYSNCSGCHRPGEIAPFSLLTYNDVLPFANGIKTVVVNRIMPPWQPQRGYGSHGFVGERALTQQQIDMIAQWVDDGALEGDATQVPPLPSFPTGSFLGTPDTVLSMTRHFTVSSTTGRDVYQTFVLPTNFSTDRQVAALEVRPGNSAIVHHVLLNQDTTGDGRRRDAQTPEYGYYDLSFNEFNNADGLGVWTPGTFPHVYPEGIGKTIYKNADILMQIHYPNYAFGDSDRTSLNVFFTRSPVQRFEKGYLLAYPEVYFNSEFQPNATGNRRCTYMGIALPSILAPISGLQTPVSCFALLPNRTTTIKARKVINEKFTLFGIYPHQHYLGKSVKAYAVTPAGDTLKIININRWDFNWQDVYRLDRTIIIPSGSTLFAEQTYDNTSSNPNNPFSPPQLVHWGEETNAEMNFTTFFGVSYQPGDENMRTTSIEDRLADAVQPKLQQSAPNPANDRTSISFYLPRSGRMNMDIMDLTGRVVKVIYRNNQVMTGEHTAVVNVSDLPNGIYVYRLYGSGFDMAKRLIVAH